MSSIYNLTSFNNNTNLFLLATELNKVTDGWLAALLILSLWIIIIIVYSGREEFINILLGSSFAVGLISGLLVYQDFLPGGFLVFPFVGLGAGLFIRIIK